MIEKPTFQHKLFESFERNPGRTAVEYGDNSVSYSQLARRAQTVRQWIINRKLEHGSFIGIYLENRLDLIASIIGILNARCVFVVLDDHLPIKRLETLIETSAVQVLLTSRKGSKKLKTEIMAVLDDDFFKDDFSRTQTTAFPSAVDSGVDREDPVYIYFTSGSTGVPKAILGRNKGLLHFLEWESDTFEVDEHFRFSQFTAPGFDAFLRDVFTPLLNGATLCIPASNDILPDRPRLIHWIHSRHIYIIHCVPSVFRLINSEELQATHFPSLKYVIMSGERIPPGQLVNWYHIFGERVGLVNLYGTSETTLAKTMYFIRPEDTKLARIPAGKAIRGSRVFVLNEDMDACPRSVAGEVYIRTPFRSLGYFNNPTANQECFIPNPFTGNTGDLFHKTGDIGRFLEDDNLDIIGRMDFQVKIRGVRVEPQEIETVLSAHPGIQEAVVTARKNNDDETCLCAYYIDKNNAQEDRVNVLREYLAEQFPDYMVPQYFIPMEAFPLTPNHKIDRKALPEPRLETGEDYIPPDTETEHVLVEIWSDVLGIDRAVIGRNSNFFRLGGHSLKATFMVEKVHQRLNVKLPLAEVFKNTTIQQLAQFITGADHDTFSPIQPVEIREYYPLSSAQKRMYILQQMDLQSTVYNMTRVFPLPVEAQSLRQHLEQSFLALVERHEALRTAFLTINDEPVQRVYEIGDIVFSMEYYDAAGDEAAARQLSSSFVRPFNLEQAPLFRVGLLQISDNELLLMSDMHHIISDGVSLTVLERDIVALFAGQELEPLNIQYKDFSLWQNSEKEHENMKQRESFWLSQLSGELPVLDLPLDYSRPDVRDFEGSLYSFEIGSVETAALKRLAMEHQATLYMVLLAIYNIFLAKICSQEEIIVGAPIAGRRHADLEKIIGMFVNTLVLRNLPSGEKTFEAFIEELRDRSIQAFDNQEYQFEDLVERLDVPRDAARNPLFDATYIMQNIGDLPLDGTPPQPAPDAAGETDGNAQTSLFNQVNPTAKFDLTLIINERPGSLAGHFQYSTRLFKEQTIERFVHYFKRVTALVLEHPGAPLGTIQLISDDEKKRILEQFNDTRRDFPQDKTLHELFVRRAAHVKDSIALCGRRQEELAPDGSYSSYSTYSSHSSNLSNLSYLSYDELNTRSTYMARYLRQKGAGPGVIAAVLMERSIDMVLAILAVLKTGAAYLPIEPGLPPERIGFMLQDSRARLTVTGSDLEALNREHESIDGIDEVTGQDVSGPAYVIYTSGSTGRPKGVIVEHRAAVNVVTRLTKDVLHQDDVQWNTGSVAPFVFDASVLHIFGALLAGNALHLVPDDTRRDGAGLIEFCRKYRLDVLEGSPGHLSIMLEAADVSGFPEHLKHLIVGGEALPKALAERMTARFGEHAPVLTNMYGPTECAVAATYFDYTGDYDGSGNTIPIGKPLGNYQIYILDPNDTFQALGIPGELCIAGTGLARGYLNNPELTSERFTPFTAQPSSGVIGIIYRSGDLGRWLPDGNIECLGRKDQQIKIRGFRIEPGEIEYQLMRQPAVKEAAVTVHQRAEGDRVLCAYIVPVPGCTVDPVAIQKGLSRSLPSYMIPSVVAALEVMPLNASGKVNRKALPAPDMVDAGEYRAPATALEQQLVQIWAAVLGLNPESISVTADFFKLGGQSLKATIMVSRVHRECNIRLPLTELFRSPTIRQLAAAIEAFETEVFSAVPAAEKREYYPLSSAQKRIYVLQQVVPQSTAYNMPLVQPLQGNTDIAQLEAVFHRLIHRHESLRTSIHLIDGQPVQRIHETVEFSIQRIGTVDTSASAKGLIRPFDLSHAPLLRVFLSGGSGTWLLIVDMHHIIADGFSLDLLSKEFMMAAAGQKLPQLKLQYKDYSQWRNSESQRFYIQRQEEFWLKQMNGDIPALELPWDYTRPEIQDFAGNSISFVVGSSETSRLRQLAHREHATVYMVFLAIYNVFLSRLSGQEEILVGAPIAGRKHAGLENIIGMFVNTLVLRNFPGGEKPFIGFLQDVKESTLAAFDNQDYPFEDLVEKVEISRDTGRNPLFDAVFVLQNTGEIPPDGPSDSSESDQSINPTAKFDLSLMMQERSDSFKAVFQYSTSLFKDETMRRWIEYFKHLVATIAAEPARELSHIHLIPDTEKQRIMEAFNRTAADYPAAKTIDSLFAEQAVKYPDRAVLSGLSLAHSSHWNCISYGKLNEDAELMAEQLRQHGAGPGSIIALKMERSLEMIVAVLAILKTGAAYLPVETGFPRQRMDYMLSDSAASLLIDAQGVHVLRPSIISQETGRASSLAYIIYTSGSTGKPKGVLTMHYNVTRLVKNTNYIDISERDRFLQLSNIAFDGSVFDIFGALLNGASLVLVPPGQSADVSRISTLIIREGVSVFFVTTALFNLFVDHTVNIFKHIRKIYAGGERLSLPHVRRALDLSGKGKIHNAYGPTETTVFATTYPIDSIEEKSMSIPIGYPISNTTIFILDKWLNPAPIGIAGEIYIGGKGTARGYLNNPELTAERFMTVSVHDSNVTVYKTGDLGRMLPGGAIEFLGRMDRQIKLRGFRVEIGEIENALLAAGHIREAVVTMEKDKTGEAYLCAYLTTAAAGEDSQSSLDINALKEILSKSLPVYMIPSFYVELPRLPLTANGKVDIRALPKPKANVESGHVAPADEVEEKVARIWQDVLGIDTVSVVDDFFEIGGHSLKGVRIANELHKSFDMDIRLTALFRHRTVRSLARYIRNAARVRYQSIRPVEKKEYYPVSSTQKRLYIVQQMDPSSIAYNMPSNFPMEAAQLDAARLQTVLKQLIDRHESLRTSFIELGGQTVQRILEPDEADIELEHYSVPPTVPDQLIEKHVNQSFVRPFDLSQAPLLRVRVSMVRDTYAVLSVDTHHIIYDEVSQDILGREVLALYSGETPAPPPLQYKDFSEWQNREIRSGRLKQQEVYWISQFEDEYPRLSIPLDYDRPPVQHFEGRRVSFMLPSEDEKQLLQFANESGSTMFIVYLALFNVLLSRLSGQNDIVVGTAVAGRTHPDLQNIIGMFVNTLAIRNYPKPGKTFLDFLAGVKKQALDAFENQDYPFESLVDKIEPDRPLNRNPVFDVLFSYHQSESGAADESGADVNLTEEHEECDSKFDLTLTVSRSKRGSIFAFKYNTALFKAQTIDSIIVLFKNIAKTVALNPERKLSELMFFNEAEKNEIFADSFADLEDE